MFDAEMQRALEADAEKLSGITGEPHSIAFVSARDARTVAAELLALAEKATFGGVWGVMGIEANTNICVAQRSDVALVCRTLLEGAQDRERLDWIDETGASIVPAWGRRGERVGVVAQDGRPEGRTERRPTVREAIDAVLAAIPGGRTVALMTTTEDTRR